MKIKAECMICESRLGKHSCSICGRVVCDECFDRQTGICIICKKGGR